jgi:GMP synthase (glutamine-hydrolysing)
MGKELYEQKILILDFGSQYTQLIARRVREAQVYCEIHPCTKSLEKIKEFSPTGIILSGGPASVYDKEAPMPEKGILDLNLPILGICYGMQYLTHVLSGHVSRAVDREYGSAEISIEDNKDLFYGFKKREGSDRQGSWGFCGLGQEQKQPCGGHGRCLQKALWGSISS